MSKNNDKVSIPTFLADKAKAQLARLDQRLGIGVGAVKERAKLAARIAAASPNKVGAA